MIILAQTVLEPILTGIMTHTGAVSYDHYILSRIHVLSFVIVYVLKWCVLNINIYNMLYKCAIS